MTQKDTAFPRKHLAEAQRVPATFAYYAAFIALGALGAVIGPTLPALAENTHTSLREISSVFALGSLGYLLGTFLGGRVYDRTPGHPVMVGTLLVMTVCVALIPLMPLLWLLVAVLFTMGFAQGALDVGGNTLLLWIHRDKVGPYMNGLHFTFGVGSFLAPIIIAQAVRLSGGITWAYWTLALLALLPALWLTRYPSPRRRSETEEAGDAKADPRLVVLIALFFVLYVGAEVSFGGWAFTYAVKLGLATEEAAAYLTSAFFGAFTVGRLVAIPIAARLRPRAILFSDLLGCLLSMGVILVWRESSTALWLGSMGLGFSMASVFPTTLTLAERRMPMTGRVTGWFFVGASLGAMTVPWIIGQLFEARGPYSAMLVIFTALLLQAGMLGALLRWGQATREG